MYDFNVKGKDIGLVRRKTGLKNMLICSYATYPIFGSPVVSLSRGGIRRHQRCLSGARFATAGLISLKKFCKHTFPWKHTFASIFI
jgi:hypothetical protein